MFATADYVTAGIIFLVVIIGLLLMRRVKKDVVEPLVERQRPIIFVRVTRGDPELPTRNVRSLPDGKVVEGQYREL